jgi:nicotinate-nucleotide adenylyltransferase
MSTQADTRVGILGGSFDPIHNAHLALAQAALTGLGLAQICFVPAGQPWQRAPLKAAPQHRLAMVRLAVKEQPHFTVDEIELQRSGASYTIDTVDALRTRQPHTNFTLLLGADQWARLTTWHRWQELVQRVDIAVAQRGDTPLVTPPELINMPVHTIAMLPMNTSSTQIRARLAGGASIAGLVPDAVARYIAQHQLYQD